MRTLHILRYAFLFAFINLSALGWADEELKPIVEQIQLLHQNKKLPIVAIGGCPGVGKSTITTKLQQDLDSLGIKAVIVSLDHYGLSPEERKQLNGELDPRRIRWDEIHNTFKSIQNGETEVVKPIINQLTKERGHETLHLADAGCVLFEGTYTLADFPPADFLQYVDLGIYLETSLDNIYDWKWEREFKKSVSRTPEQFYNHMIEILKDFAFHVYPTKKNADIIVQIDFWHHYSPAKNDIRGVKTEPDFTKYRLEILNYDQTPSQIQRR